MGGESGGQNDGARMDCMHVVKAGFESNKKYWIGKMAVETWACVVANLICCFGDGNKPKQIYAVIFPAHSKLLV